MCCSLSPSSSGRSPESAFATKSQPPSARACGWGGVPPLGYEVRERRLVVNPTEANTVRYIYERYLELGCVRQLSKALDERGIVSKVRISKKGIKSGGCRFSRGALYELLANPIH